MGANPEYASGEVIANKYVVEGPQGESPNGRTFLANAGLGSQKLVVKIFRADLSERLLSAPDFFLKANVASEIEHDNLAACIEVQEEMGHIYSARAHVEGHDFEEWLRRNRRETNYFTRGQELLWQACQGLSALHERTRHLNIHPGNLLVSPLAAKLADWDPRSLGSMEMTPDPLPFRPAYAGYRAPEMSGRGSFLSYPSTDLYAVAGLLYRLVMSEHPETDLNKLQAGIRSLEKDLGGFLAKAMHPRAEERFQDASAFSDGLWELQGAMQRLQDRQPRSTGRESTSFRAPVPPPPPPRPEPSQRQDPFASTARPDPFAAAPSGPEGTLFGDAPAAQPTAAAPVKDDSFFNFFPSDQPQVSAAPGRRQPTPPPTPQPASNETFFGSSLESPAPASGGTLFGDPPPARPATRHGGGLESLENSGSGTLFGSEPPRKSHRKPEAKPAAISLTSLEKDPLDAEAEQGSGGFTQFGFKGSGGDHTLIAEGKANRHRKLVMSLAALGILILLIALGGLFVYLRSTAAPDVPAGKERPVEDEPFVQETPKAPDPGTTSNPQPADPAPTTERPPYAVDEPTPPPPDPEPIAVKTPPPPPRDPEPARPKQPAGAAPKGSPERLAQLMKMIETREWPASGGERLRAADELNDFGKIAEANVVYGRTMLAAEVTEKQKVAALGGLAVTFYGMGMKEQSMDAINQLLDINPRNAFALKFKEKLK